MAGSAVDAISHAVERSKQLLFPMKAEKWFPLGFTVFMAQCGDGQAESLQQLPGIPGGSSGPTLPRGGATSELQRLLEDALRAFRDDFTLYVTLGLVALVIGLGIWLFVLWFSSRAKLMFVESVIWDRVDVGAQWTRAADLGMSLFKFRVWLGVGGWLLFTMAVGVTLLVGLADFQTGLFFGPKALMGYALGGFTLLLLGLPLAIAGLLLDDFVVPLMVVRNARVSEAWGMCRTEVLSGNVGGIIVFYVMRMLLFVATAIATVMLRCLTCCLSGIPYLGTVLLLPISVFSRAYPLYYLEQLGLQIFPRPQPSWDAYDQWRFPR